MVDDPTTAKLSSMPREAVRSPAETSADRRASDTRIAAKFRNLFFAPPGGGRKSGSSIGHGPAWPPRRDFFLASGFFEALWGCVRSKGSRTSAISQHQPLGSGTNYFPLPLGALGSQEGFDRGPAGWRTFPTRRFREIFLEGSASLIIGTKPRTLSSPKTAAKFTMGGVGEDRIRQGWRLK